MGQHDLRHDNECQNCGHTVEIEYCSKCGQQNTETRQSFVHLVRHFAEDLTHYDGAFWKTIKYLLFRPAKLTIEYLEGYRQRYVPPVKLYIFVSFVCFLLISLLFQKEHTTIEERAQNIKISKAEGIKINDEGRTYRSVKELDSIEHSLPKNKQMDIVEYWFTKGALVSAESGNKSTDITEAILHIMPKVMFIYMPIFAFWLWLVHGKKRWLFFDHGIFTLHYFSLILLLFTVVRLFGSLVSYLINAKAGLSASVILFFILFTYAFFYFFISHKKLYGEKWYISGIKGLLLFCINTILIVFTIVLSYLYTMLNAH